MRKISRILIVILKNLAIFLFSGLLTVLLIFLFSKKNIIDLVSNPDLGLGIIAIIPVLIIYFIIFGIAGGLLGVIIYHLFNFFRKRISLK